MIDTLLRWLGYGLCHQLPERSFFAGSHQLPVCARDTGIYVGFVLSLVVVWLLSRPRRPSEFPPPATLAVAGLFIAAMAWDGVTSYAGWRTTTNDIRLATGLVSGYAIGLLLVPILNGQLWRGVDRSRVLPDVRSAVLWLLPLPFAWVLLRWPLGALGVAYPLMVAAAILATFTAVNLTVVTLLPAAEGRAERLRDARVWILVAFVFTIAEIAASAWFKAALVRLVGGR